MGAKVRVLGSAPREAQRNVLSVHHVVHQPCVRWLHFVAAAQKSAASPARRVVAGGGAHHSAGRPLAESFRCRWAHAGRDLSAHAVYRHRRGGDFGAYAGG